MKTLQGFYRFQKKEFQKTLAPGKGVQYCFVSEVHERGLMRLRRSKARKGAILVLVATGMVVLLMASCLVLDYALFKTAGMRLKNSCELAQISANLAAGGAPADPKNPNDPWMKTAKRILLGNGVTPEELAAATITVGDDGTVAMTIPRKVDLIHPYLWKGKGTASARLVQIAPDKDSQGKPGTGQESPPQPYEGYDQKGRYIVRKPEAKPDEAQKTDNFVVASEQAADSKQMENRPRRKVRIVRPNGVGDWFAEAPPWWTPPVQHEDEDEDLDKFEEPKVEERVYRPKGNSRYRFDNGPTWYPSSEWLTND